VTDPVSAKPIAELRGMSKQDLIAAHDEIAGWGRSVFTAEDYRAELARRDSEDQTRTMLCLEVGILRAERALRRPGDIKAALADPLLPDEISRLLR
jgi:hypothetical protein